MNQKAIAEAKARLFIDLPEVIRKEAFKSFLDNYLIDGNEEPVFMGLAARLMGTVDTALPLREEFDDTPLKKLHTMCVTILSLFYPIEEVMSLIRNPEYEPKPYQPLNSPQDKLVSAIARQMLQNAYGTDFFDETADIPGLRGLLYEGTLGKLGWSGLRSKEGGPKSLEKRKDNFKDRNEWLIGWALELYNKHGGKHSAYTIAGMMHSARDEWEKAGEIEKEDNDDKILSQYRIHAIIKKFLPSRKRTGN